MKDQALFEKAKKWIPGGVNSPVRAFGAVGGTPRFLVRGEGAYVWDREGRKYVDYVLAWGPLILGHAHPKVVEGICQQAALGTGFGAPTELEVELAEKIVSMVPSVEMVRLVNSGTEATMSAVRLARAFTKRPKILKFAGCYHGHGDCFLIQAGSGASTFSVPTSPGVPEGVSQDTLVCEFNDLEGVKQLFEKWGDQIGAVILEPVVGNMGILPPEEGFLTGLREITKKFGALLIFDEVMTGFRLAPGGAQERFCVWPDLTTLGKVIGGGMPVGAYGGRREIMKLVAPEGPVYQAGTLSGNPLSVRAGLETLKILSEEPVYEHLEKIGKLWRESMEDWIEKRGVPLSVYQIGSMACLYFRERVPKNQKEAKTADLEKFKRYFHAMLEKGVYLPPSPFEAFFFSYAHTESLVLQTSEIMQSVLETLFL